jgi:ubiquinol-cytochrome c reductase iron-sulfur subunit
MTDSADTNLGQADAGTGRDLLLLTTSDLGCSPLGQKSGDDCGLYGGWFCPCLDSMHYSLACIRQGPASLNLAVPPYALTGNAPIKIG